MNRSEINSRVANAVRGPEREWTPPFSPLSLLEPRRHDVPQRYNAEQEQPRYLERLLRVPAKRELFTAAGYDAEPDTIYLPPSPWFHGPHLFASTLVHELAHWTGHASRLNRGVELLNRGRPRIPYALEEITAALTQLYIGNALRIPENPEVYNYLRIYAAWLPNPEAWRASIPAAERATRYIMREIRRAEANNGNP